MERFPQAARLKITDHFMQRWLQRIDPLGTVPQVADCLRRSREASGRELAAFQMRAGVKHLIKGETQYWVSGNAIVVVSIPRGDVLELVTCWRKSKSIEQARSKARQKNRKLRTNERRNGGRKRRGNHG